MTGRRVDVVVIPRSGPSVTSMDRFASALLEMDQPGVQVRRPAVSHVGRGFSSKWATRWQRWVGNPVRLKRTTAEIFHIVDHSDAHLLKVLPDIRTVVTCHDLVLMQALGAEIPYAGQRWWGTRFRWTVSHLRRAAAVACDSEATRNDVRRFLGVAPERLHVIPLAAGRHFRPPSADERARLRTALGIAGRRTVLHVGSGGFYKNITTIFEVVAHLRHQGEDIVIARVGAELGDSDRMLITRLGIQDVVLDFGRVSERRLVELYSAADVLLFPSTGEGFGLPVLEAMSCGLPVVASAIPPLVELTDRAARLAAPTDVDRLAEHVHAVLSDPDESNRMRKSGLERAATYSWEKTLEGYARLYWEVFEEATALR